MGSNNRKYIGRFGVMKYEYFEDTYQFEIIDANDVCLSDDRGEYYEYEETMVDKMVFTSDEVNEVGGYEVVKEMLENTHSFQNWGSVI